MVGGWLLLVGTHGLCVRGVGHAVRRFVFGELGGRMGHASLHGFLEKWHFSIVRSQFLIVKWHFSSAARLVHEQGAVVAVGCFVGVALGDFGVVAGYEVGSGGVDEIGG